LQDKLGWQKALKEGKHIVEFYLNKLVFEVKGASNKVVDDKIKRKLGKAVQEEVLPFVILIESEIEKANFVEKIANQLEVPDKVIWEELAKIKKIAFSMTRQSEEEGFDRKKSFVKKLSLKKDKKNRKQIILRQLAGLYWWQKDIKQPIFDFQLLRKNIKKNIGNDIFKKIEKLPEKIKDEIVFEVEILYGDVENIEEKIIELLKNLEIELLNEKIKKVVFEQKQAEKEGNSRLALKKLEMYNQLSKQKSQLCN